jgi:hypothetical protein
MVQGPIGPPAREPARELRRMARSRGQIERAERRLLKDCGVIRGRRNERTDATAPPARTRIRAVEARSSEEQEAPRQSGSAGAGLGGVGPVGGDLITEGYNARGGDRAPLFQRAHIAGHDFTFAGSANHYLNHPTLHSLKRKASVSTEPQAERVETELRAEGHCET